MEFAVLSSFCFLRSSYCIAPHSLNVVINATAMFRSHVDVTHPQNRQISAAPSDANDLRTNLVSSSYAERETIAPPSDPVSLQSILNSSFSGTITSATGSSS